MEMSLTPPIIRGPYRESIKVSRGREFRKRAKCQIPRKIGRSKGKKKQDSCVEEKQSV